MHPRTPYNRHRLRRIAQGRWHRWTDAEPARQHVNSLRAAGIGVKRVAELAGVSHGMMTSLMYERGGRPRSRRIRPEAAEAILAVRPVLESVSDGAFVDATGTRRRLQALIACGWSMSALTARLGMNKTNGPRMLTQQYVTARVARQVAALYEDLWNVPPPQETHWQRTAVTKVTKLARERGWAPPYCWDDGPGDEDSPHYIENPEARPAGQSRRETAA